MRVVRFLSALAAIGMSTAAFAAPSTFQNSCSDIKLSADAAKITATCKKKDGTPVPATMDIVGVENVDGKLTRTGSKTNFQETCHTPHLGTNDKHVVLTAICKKRNGAPSNTQLELMDINNIDGVLKQ